MIVLLLLSFNSDVAWCPLHKVAHFYRLIQSYSLISQVRLVENCGEKRMCPFVNNLNSLPLSRKEKLLLKQLVWLTSRIREAIIDYCKEVLLWFKVLYHPSIHPPILFTLTHHGWCLTWKYTHIVLLPSHVIAFVLCLAYFVPERSTQYIQCVHLSNIYEHAGTL